MIKKLTKEDPHFPHPNEANQDGILAWGGDLSPTRLMNAYKNGIFPWYVEDQPILWWSPSPRLIMELEDFKISRSLKKSIKKFTYKFDYNFNAVIRNCGTKKRNNQLGTWIQPDIIEAYSELHKRGIAHSIESYQNGLLVGGLYGLAIGKVFCGESMFSYTSDASKSAYAMLIKHLKEWGYDFIDCQVPTEHLKSLGAKEVSREYFLERLVKSTQVIEEQKWKINKKLI